MMVYLSLAQLTRFSMEYHEIAPFYWKKFLNPNFIIQVWVNKSTVGNSVDVFLWPGFKNMRSRASKALM